MNYRGPLFLTSIALGLFLPGNKSLAVDFEKDIQPILKDHCFKCHSGPNAKAKIRYDNVRYFKEVVGDHPSAIVVPGSPDKSKLLKLASLPQTSTDAMPPPKRGVPPMNSAELSLVRKWIEEGAKLEGGAEAAPAITETPTATVNQVQEWTNSDGKSLKAAFVSADDSAVTLRKEDGQEIKYPLNKLSAESRQLVEKLSKLN
jgi:Planctomycete cytochrome C/SLA1 homology domain 1, SHD1